MPSDSSVKSDEEKKIMKSDEENEETKKVCHELHDTPYFVDYISQISEIF